MKKASQLILSKKRFRQLLLLRSWNHVTRNDHGQNEADEKNAVVLKSNVDRISKTASFSQIRTGNVPKRRDMLSGTCGKSSFRFWGLLFSLVAALITSAAGNLAAREQLSLDGTWQFALDADQNGESQSWFASDFVLPNAPPAGSAPEVNGTIQVPGIWDNQGYGGETDKLRHHFVGHGWYKRTFQLPADWQGNDVTLTLGGISRYAKVWINGQQAGPELIGQVASFSIDVTPLLRFGQENDITIRVDSRQRWEIDAILGAASLNDYLEIEWGGLWGHVTLEARPKERLDDLYLKTNLAEKTCTAQATIYGGKTADAVKIEIFDAQQKLVAEKTAPLTILSPTSDVSVSAVIENAQLWTPDTPHLYTVKLTLLAGKTPLDTVESRYGMRELRTDGTTLLLNDKPFLLRGYGDDHIYPYEFSMSTDKAMYLARLKIIKSFGFNHVRHHSTILPHEYYEACDEVGIMPTGEFPIGYPHQLPGNDLWRKNVPEGTPHEPSLATYRERFAQVVREYRNHPCILTWVMGNELWCGMSIKDDFKKIAKNLDPQRFFCDSDGDGVYFFDQDTVTISQRYWNTADTSVVTIPGRDRDTLDLFFIMFDELGTPIVPGKFSPTGFKKPVISHESGNFITFSRTDQIEMFNDGLFPENPSLADRSPTDLDKPLVSNYKPFWMTDGAQKLRELGLDGEVERWAQASEELYYIHHKFNIEGMRMNPEIAGYHWWLIQDYWTTSNGLVDLFFRPKSIEPQRVRIFNAPLVILQQGLELTYRSGDALAFELFLSNFSDSAVNGTLEWTAVLNDSDVFQSRAEPAESVAPGERKSVCAVKETLPTVEKPTELEIRAVLKNADGDEIKSNFWKAWVYPATQKAQIDKPVYASNPVLEMCPNAGFEPLPTEERLPTDAVYVTSHMTPNLIDALDAGAGVVLLGETTIFPCLTIQYQQTWWKGGESDDKNHVGTFVYPTEIMQPLETENWCQPHWFSLLNGAVKYNLEQLPSRPVVHLRALPSLVRVQDTAVIFDVSVGRGTLVVSGLNHDGAKGRPENDAAILSMVRRAASQEKSAVAWPKTAIQPTETAPEE